MPEVEPAACVLVFGRRGKDGTDGLGLEPVPKPGRRRESRWAVERQAGVRRLPSWQPGTVK
ncbi:MAG: hypothetical protein D6815_10565 [Candidatus Dadabacteria bacterium]|nr:MAG: hypothetical protein D6815_10565 [Candidatus Dadabacteria bacterium]